MEVSLNHENSILNSHHDVGKHLRGNWTRDQWASLYDIGLMEFIEGKLKKVKVGILTILPLVLTMVLLSCRTAPARKIAHTGLAPKKQVRALWVWGSFTKTKDQQDLLRLARQRKLNTLYFESTALIAHDHGQDTLAKFVKAARKSDIDVEFLFGAPRMALAENHSLALNLTKQTLRYMDRHPEAPPSAIHFDIEPYALEQWKQGDRVANDFLDLLEKIRLGLSGRLPLIVDIPVWFDDDRIEREGKDTGLLEAVIESADGITLMDYRDNIERIIAAARAEVELANKYGKTIYVGLETTCSETTWISFCEEGRKRLDFALQAVRKNFASEPAFGGTAIHHFKSFKKLKP